MPLISLVLPSRAHAIGKSLLLIKEQGGDIPRWPIATVYSGCMIGNHANIILAELGLKNLLSASEIAYAYAGARAAVSSDRAHAGRDGWKDYDALGYIPTDGYDKAASETLAYAYVPSQTFNALILVCSNHTDSGFCEAMLSGKKCCGLSH